MVAHSLIPHPPCPYSSRPPDPFQNDALLPISQVYAIIEQVGYLTRTKRITYSIGYYASEAAYQANAAALHITALPSDLAQPATPEQANAVPIFQFLEQVLTQQLTSLLAAGTTIENVA